jgi:hypothetical protein
MTAPSWFTHVLAHTLTASLAIGASLLLTPIVHPSNRATIMSVDKPALIAQFDDELSSPWLSEKARTQRLTQFSRTLARLIHTYEAKTGAIVVSQDALLTPKHDITPEVEQALRSALTHSADDHIADFEDTHHANDAVTPSL